MSVKPMHPVVRLPCWLADAVGKLAGAYVEELSRKQARPPEVLDNDRKTLHFLQEALNEAAHRGDHMQPPTFYHRQQFFIAVPLQCKMLVQDSQGNTLYLEENDWQMFRNGEHGCSVLIRDEAFRQQFAPANERAKHLLMADEDVPSPPEAF